MRSSIKELFKNVITLKYTLPYNSIPKSVISTSDDFIFKANSDEDIATLIYNSIVDLAFDDYQINVNNLNELQKKALNYRIRFNVGDDEAKLKLGFYGEALLNIFLQVFFGTDVLVVRGEFFDLLSMSEVHGYDCHHIIERDNSLEFWCGEAKFYASYTRAFNKIWETLNKDISFDFLNRNLQVIVQKKYNISAKGKLIDKFFNECKADPFRNYYEDIKKYGGNLVYPILVISNEGKFGLDKFVQNCISKINELNKRQPIMIPKDLSVALFFIFVPIEDAKKIKLEVLEWIQKNKPLI